MTCRIDGCVRPKRGDHGYCKLHADRVRRHGDPLVCLKPKSPYGEPLAWIERHKDHQGDSCLIWPFARNVDGRAHMFRVKPCRVMCTLRHGEPPAPNYEAAHSCGKGHEGCIHPAHLRWATPAENAKDKIGHGTAKTAGRLTPDDIREIRSLRGTVRNIDIAKKFGISDGHVANIFRGAKWKAPT